MNHPEFTHYWHNAARELICGTLCNGHWIRFERVLPLPDTP